MKQINKFLILAASAMAIETTAVAQEKENTQTAVTTAQSKLSQKVHGRVLDAASKQPMPGVVVILLSNNQVNATTDDDGYFILNNVPVGRQSFQFSFMGYETYTAPEAMVITGKELELNIAMNESLKQLKEVTVSAGKDRIKPMNEFAAVSARSFSVDEARRYAASFADPARMAQNFPGVSNSGDMDNSIVVRGNSPKGVLWRLEGIEIPNPNHFSSLGATGGAISMLNANVLGNSDFYTGAFAPEIGNATAGAFDLNFRNGNTERYEHTVQIGTIGAEIATEGPFKKGKKASYLFNYRYSTLDLIESFMDLGGTVPDYQDMSFKINLPTEKAGTFSAFGIGGYNRAYQNAPADSSKWNDDTENVSFDSRGKMGTVGISHQYFIHKDAYLKTIISGSYDQHTEQSDTLNPAEGYHKVPTSNTRSSNTAYRASVLYNQKLNARHTFRTGVIAQHLAYDMNNKLYISSEKQWKDILTGDGSTQFYQAYLQWRARVTEKVTVVGGVHGAYLALNQKYAIEPRASVTYAPNKNKFTLSAGLHSKPEHISTYYFENIKDGETRKYPNKDLDMLRALHTVAGYETTLPLKMRLKAEVYYQRHYNIPVEADSNKSFSLLNANDMYSLLSTNKPLVSQGTGDNYGVDLSLERPFANNYYVLASGSVYKATYTDYAGRTYNSQFNRGYQVNLIGGKEFPLTASGRKIIGLNGKVLFSGGLRESVIDINKSMANGKTEFVADKYFTKQTPAYFRTDASVYYKINNKKATHTIQLDIQNVTNRSNYYFSYFDADAGKVKTVYQLGMLPNLSYRIDFHW
ncbi:MAG: TonB-dependent receptor [Sphingobacteriales bacterium]|nr:MAG: TonB-dependent receptor [Sphingobacteriales bacterium]